MKYDGEALEGRPAPPIPNSYWVPGERLLGGEYPGALERAAARQKIAALLQGGVRVLLDLTAPADRMASYDDILSEEAARLGITTVRRIPMPVRDMDIASPEAMNDILDAIDEQTAAGHTVYVHCWGGVGRTGLVIGCHLVRHGLEGPEALARVDTLFGSMSADKVRRHGGRSPQTSAQRDMLVGWAQHDRIRTATPRARDKGVSVRDRYLGALLGLAVGDALGTTLEFRPPGSFQPITDMVGGGPFRLAAGQWTDDTSMALCLAESLLECGGFDAADQCRRYLRWMQHGHWSSNGRCFDVGNTVRSALYSFQRTGVGFSGSTDENSAGNGSLMRLAPVPMFYNVDAERAIKMAADSSRTTHGTATAVDACRYYAGLVIGALRGTSKEDLLAPHYSPLPGLWERAPLHPLIDAVAAGSFHRNRPPTIKGTGYVVDCLEAALWAFVTTDDFESGALAAVNLGNDADSTGAVYGQLAGAYYGVEQIPMKWRERIARVDEISAMAGRLYEASGVQQQGLDAHFGRKV